MKDQTNMVGILLALLLLGALAAPADAIEWRQGTVTFSSDRTVNGKVYVLRDSLYVYDLASQERRNVAVGNIKRIEMVVRDEKMAKKWYFKESGSDEKIYTGDRYPVRRFYVRITFHDGSTLRGKPISRTVYVQTEEGREHYKLGQKQEGEVGQKLKDLVYLKSITFGEGGPGVTGSITASIRAPSGERVQRDRYPGCVRRPGDAVAGDDGHPGRHVTRSDRDVELLARQPEPRVVLSGDGRRGAPVALGGSAVRPPRNRSRPSRASRPSGDSSRTRRRGPRRRRRSAKRPRGSISTPKPRGRGGGDAGQFDGGRP